MDPKKPKIFWARIENKVMDEQTIETNQLLAWDLIGVQNRALHENIWKGIKYKVTFKMTGEVGDI